MLCHRSHRTYNITRNLDCKDPKFVNPTSDTVHIQPEPAVAEYPAGGGDAQLEVKDSNPKVNAEDPVKVGDKAITIPDPAELDHGDWLVVTRRKRSSPKIPQPSNLNDKITIGGFSKSASGPVTKDVQSGPRNVVGPTTKNQAIKLDSGKRRRQDKSTPTHVLLKNAGKEVYVNPINTGTPVLETGALLAPQAISSGVPFYKKEDPPSCSIHGTQFSSPVHDSSTPPLEPVDFVPDSQISHHDVVPNDVSMHE
ncbi:hypothetical protein RIF29_21392 [Crotalaria pallida]|uniref:Uncharacterized protein n=1 Tax=Crotalaria pallida TaxID=3830 RepID=A0AAN9F4G3_CROPI